MGRSATFSTFSGTVHVYCGAKDLVELPNIREVTLACSECRELRHVLRGCPQLCDRYLAAMRTI